MWKLVVLLLSVASVSFASMLLADQNLLSPIQQARIKYPYSLIGDDFGILNEDDLAANTCDAIPQPFSYKSMAFIYWECFQTHNVSFICDQGDGIPDPHEGLLAFIVLKVSGEDGEREYLARRPWPMKSCRKFG